jgi:hypothetical protein
MPYSHSLPLPIKTSFHQGRPFCPFPWCACHIPAIYIPVHSHKWMHWCEWPCANASGMLPMCGHLQRWSCMNNKHSNLRIFAQHWSEGGSSTAVPSVGTCSYGRSVTFFLCRYLMSKNVPIPPLVDQIVTHKIRQTAQNSSKYQSSIFNTESFVKIWLLLPIVPLTRYQPYITQTWLISQAHPM